jgi:hypothetical protein
MSFYLPPASGESADAASPVGDPQWVCRTEGRAVARALLPPACGGVDH